MRKTCSRMNRERQKIKVLNSWQYTKKVQLRSALLQVWRKESSITRDSQKRETLISAFAVPHHGIWERGKTNAPEQGTGTQQSQDVWRQLAGRRLCQLRFHYHTHPASQPRFLSLHVSSPKRGTLRSLQTGPVVANSGLTIPCCGVMSLKNGSLIDREKTLISLKGGASRGWIWTATEADSALTLWAKTLDVWSLSRGKEVEWS